MYQLVLEALEGAMRNAPKQQQLDMMQTINERAAVIYMDAKSVIRGRQGLEGSLWASEQLFKIKLDSQIEDLKVKVDIESTAIQAKKEEERRRELEKKDPEVIFKEMLFR